MGQPARLEEDFVTNPIKSSTKMALAGFRTHYSPHRNFPPINPVENELARDPSLTRGLHSSSISLAPSSNPTLGLALVPALVSALISTLVSAPVPTNKLFKQVMKTYLESNQGLRQPLRECKRPLKAKVLEVYYGKSYMDCYPFCQQCEDHFETARATKTNKNSLCSFFALKEY